VNDAKKCIEIQPAFIKGYYRLVAGLIGHKDYTGATQVAKAGLQVDAGNTELSKQLRIIKTKVASIAAKKKAER
jgi:hypothetical protein